MYPGPYYLKINDVCMISILLVMTCALHLGGKPGQKSLQGSHHPSSKLFNRQLCHPQGQQLRIRERLQPSDPLWDI